jgi:hypothetical protein
MLIHGKSEKYLKPKRARGVAQMVGYLLSKCEALGSNPNTTHTHKRRSTNKLNRLLLLLDAEVCSMTIIRKNFDEIKIILAYGVRENE